MQSTDFIQEIERLFPTMQVVGIVSALRQDALVWSCLQEETFLKLISGNAGKEIDLWRPANLGLVAVGARITAQQLIKNPSTPPGLTLQQRAIHRYEETLNLRLVPVDLADATLLALALRERRRLTKTWAGVRQEIIRNEPHILTDCKVWRTPLACLFGMVPDPKSMMDELVGNVISPEVLDLASHIILCNGVTFSERISFFQQSLVELPLSVQLLWLKNLSLRDQKDLVMRLAQEILEKEPSYQRIITNEFVFNNKDVSDIYEGIQVLQNVMMLFALAGQVEKANSIAKQLEQGIRLLDQGVSLLKMNLDVHAEEVTPQNTRIQMDILKKDVNILAAETILGLTEQLEAPNETLNYLKDNPDPFVQIWQAWQMAKTGQTERARIIAREVISQILKQGEKGYAFPNPLFVYKIDASRFVRMFLEMGLPLEGFEFSRVLMQSRPSDVHLMSAIADCLEKIGDTGEAIQYIRTSISLRPGDGNLHRQLAGLYETQNEYSSAIAERRNIIQLLEEPHADDWMALINDCLKLDYLEEAFTACQKAKQIYPNHAPLQAALGQILYKMGELEAAIQSLAMAVLFDSKDRESWKLLASIYEQQGDIERAIGTMGSAISALPESAEMHYVLSELHLRNGQAQEATQVLLDSLKLCPEYPQVAENISRRLVDKGKLEEALIMLDIARQIWPQEPRVAYLSAQVLAELGQMEAASQALEVVLRLGQPDADQYVLYADVICGRELFEAGKPVDAGKMISAQQALKQALLLQPDHFLGRLLLAELLHFRREYPSAYEIFNQLQEEGKEKNGKLRRRVQIGLGKAALMLGEVETALAALQDISQIFPDDIRLHQLLAEAFLQADLKHDATQVARIVLKLNPDQRENLLWYVDFMLRLDRPTDAIEGLHCAIEMSPTCADYWIQLAEVQVKTGDLESARKSLEILNDLEKITQDHLCRAGMIYLRLNDHESALYTLERAICISNDPPVDLVIEVAMLYCQNGNIEAATDLLQSNVERYEKAPEVRILLSDLYALAGKFSAAHACLEHVQSFYENQIDEPHIGSNMVDGMITQRWLQSLSSPVDLQIRMIYLLIRLGDLKSAYTLAEVAVKVYPFDSVIRWVAAEIASGMLKNKDVAGLLSDHDLINFSKADYSKLTSEEQMAVLGMDCLKIELMLEEELITQAGKTLQDDLNVDPKNPHLLNCQARLMYRQGNTKAANEIYQDIVNGPEYAAYLNNKSSWVDHSPKSILVNYLNHSFLYSMGLSALELRFWEDAVTWSVAYCEKMNDFPKAPYSLARALIVGAEMHRKMVSLKVRAHLPGGLFLSQENEDKCNKALNDAAYPGNEPLIQRWIARAKTVYHPTQATVHLLEEIAETPDEYMALINGLRQVGVDSNINQYIEKFVDHPGILMDGAISMLKSQPQEGLALAQRGMELNPMDPLQHISLAFCEERMGHYDRALDVLEVALGIWPDEPEWHVMAADLAGKCGINNSALYHRQQAYSLKPEYIDYALSLGKAYIEINNSSRAIEVLGKASRLAPQCFFLWILLAKAYHQAEMIGQALDCINRAKGLDAKSALPVLLNGEIALDMENLEQAFECAQEAYRRDPLLPEAILFYARVLILQGRIMEGLALIEHSLPTHENTMPILYERARITRIIHGVAAALPMMNDLVKKFPEEVDVLVLHAQMQIESGESLPAEVTLRTGLRINPNHADLNYMMGRIKFQAGQLDQAIHFFSEAIHHAPNHLEAYLDLGKAHEQRREHLQALKVYQQAMKLAPDEYRAYYYTGMVLKDSKDYAGAEVMLRRAASLAPDDVHIRKQLGAVITLNLVHNSLEVNTHL
jgi:tetratricopeptide (TPR) repeat protein